MEQEHEDLSKEEVLANYYGDEKNSPYHPQSRYAKGRDTGC
jgi:hypothetical protein